MKIEIDLNDILGDEFGSETLQESIKRQIVDHLINVSKAAVKDRINSEVAKAIDEEIKMAIKDQMPKIINDLINMEYYPTDKWGNRADPITFRNQLLKVLCAEMVYKTQRYESDRNEFTKAVDSIIQDAMKEFKELFKTNVDDIFFKEAVLYATENLKTKLGIKP